MIKQQVQFRCPHCGNRILQQDPNDGSYKIRTAIILFSPDGTSARMPCRYCHNVISVPVELNLRKVPVVVPARDSRPAS